MHNAGTVRPWARDGAGAVSGRGTALSIPRRGDQQLPDAVGYAGELLFGHFGEVFAHDGDATGGKRSLLELTPQDRLVQGVAGDVGGKVYVEVRDPSPKDVHVHQFCARRLLQRRGATREHRSEGGRLLAVELVHVPDVPQGLKVGEAGGRITRAHARGEPPERVPPDLDPPEVGIDRGNVTECTIHVGHGAGS